MIIVCCVELNGLL